MLSALEESDRCWMESFTRGVMATGTTAWSELISGEKLRREEIEDGESEGRRSLMDTMAGAWNHLRTNEAMEDLVAQPTEESVATVLAHVQNAIGQFGVDLAVEKEAREKAKMLLRDATAEGHTMQAMLQASLLEEAKRVHATCDEAAKVRTELRDEAECVRKQIAESKSSLLNRFTVTAATLVIYSAALGAGRPDVAIAVWLLGAAQ